MIRAVRGVPSEPPPDDQHWDELSAVSAVEAEKRERERMNAELNDEECRLFLESTPPRPRRRLRSRPG